jgi:protein phosphatase
MNYTYCAQTHPGLTRGNNEDSVAFDEVCGVTVLADGMGGYNAGEVASGMATVFIKSELVQWLSSDANSTSASQTARAIEECIEKANLSILKAATSNPQYEGMGTTVVVGIFQGNYLILGHVGDSRCYRLRGRVLTQITKDHSLLQERVDAGLLTPSQAATAPGKNLLTRAVGVETTLQVEMHTHLVEAEDIYLMCSDGLTDMVSDDDIARTIGSGSDLTQRAADLVDRANAGGGRDNITVLLIRAKSTSVKPGLMSRLFGGQS